MIGLYPFPPERILSLDGARMAAEFRDHSAVLARDRDVVDAGAAGALLLDAASGQPVAQLAGIDESDRALLRHAALVIGVAGVGESGIGKREDIAAMRDIVTVHHLIGDGHRKDGAAGLDRDQLHAEPLARGIFRPHPLGTGACDGSRVHRSGALAAGEIRRTFFHEGLYAFRIVGT